jgi:general secretion pathway protein E
MLGSTLRGVMAQRLVRRLCTCARPHEAGDTLAAMLAERVAALEERSAPNLLQPVGCEACHGTGYDGQLSIAEVITIDADLRRCIIERRPAGELERRAREKGMASMYEDGVRKAWSGVTTLEEVMRVTSEVGG